MVAEYLWPVAKAVRATSWIKGSGVPGVSTPWIPMEENSPFNDTPHMDPRSKNCSDTMQAWSSHSHSGRTTMWEISRQNLHNGQVFREMFKDKKNKHRSLGATWLHNAYSYVPKLRGFQVRQHPSTVHLHLANSIAIQRTESGCHLGDENSSQNHDNSNEKEQVQYYWHSPEQRQYHWTKKEARTEEMYTVEPRLSKTLVYVLSSCHVNVHLCHWYALKCVQ